MYNIIERYISRLTKDDINNFALSKDIHLSDQELDFTCQNLEKLLLDRNVGLID